MQKETSFPQKQKPLELYAGIFLDFYGVFSFLDFGGIFCFCVLNEFINF